MSVNEKLDEILKNQGIIIQMLTDIMEAMPAPGKHPDMLAAMAPLLNSPMIKGNPALADMVGTFMKNMGGNHE